VVPTVFYGFSPDKEENLLFRDWGETASQISTCSDAFWKIVEEADLDWVYVREDVGSLRLEGLAGCQGVEKVYENESVSIWKMGK